MKTLITVKTDPRLKERAQRAARDLGFPLGTLLNAYMRQLVRGKTIHFSTMETLIPSVFLEEVLNDAANDMMHDRLSPRFSTAANAIAHLRTV